MKCKSTVSCSLINFFNQTFENYNNSKTVMMMLAGSQSQRFFSASLIFQSLSPSIKFEISLLRQTVHRLIQSSYSRWVRVFSVTVSIYLSIVEFSFNDFVTSDLKLEHDNRKNSPVDQHRSIDLSHNNICHRAEEHLIDWLRERACALRTVYTWNWY